MTLGALALSRRSRPKCVSTAEIFGDLSVYSHHADPASHEEDGKDSDEDLDLGEVSPTRDTLGPLRGRERGGLRISAGVRPKPTRRPSAECSWTPKTKASLPPQGKMRCLWGDDCAVEKAFDYTKDTIKGWKDHIASHLIEPSDGKVVNCRWGGCNEKMRREYLFKHIVTHEVRFKQLCPRGCGVAFRDDNLARHLKVCSLRGR